MQVVRLALLLLCLCLANVAQAADFKPYMTLYGTPKYTGAWTHFAYTNPDAPKGGALKTAVIGTYDSLNPFILKGQPAAGLDALGSGLVYESLMTQAQDEPFTLYPLLASGAAIAADRLSVTFRLNPAAKWADGTPVSAQDVAFTFQTLIDKGQPFYKGYYADIKNVITDGTQQVTFHFAHDQNLELPLIIAQMPILPAHIWTAPGADFTRTTLSPPMGSGPYTIAKVDAGRSITYAKRADWWGVNLPANRGRWNFKTVTFDYYKDDMVALEALFAGQYHIRQENIAKTWAKAYNVPVVTSGRIKREGIKNQRPQGIQAFIFNIRKPIFTDARVREAIGYAFDFEWSNRQFAFGSYQRSNSFFENSDLAAHMPISAAEIALLSPFRDTVPPNVFKQPFAAPVTDGSGNARANLKQAVILLEQAGYRVGPDGIRVNDKGQRLAFQIIDANPMLERWILPFLRNLRKIGIQADLRVIDPAQYQNRMQNFDFDMTSGVLAQSASPGNEQLEMWGSAAATRPGSQNYIGIQSPAVDALVQSIVHAKTRVQLQTATRALDRVLLWNHYVIPQWFVGEWRMAYWDTLQRPETLSHYTAGVVDTWWMKPPETGEK
ncbi:MAG: extracellular solute-binding protein [Pseudomonadota bacterium]